MKKFVPSHCQLYHKTEPVSELRRQDIDFYCEADTITVLLLYGMNLFTAKFFGWGYTNLLGSFV